MKKVLVIGSSNYDIFSYVDTFPRAGETISTTKEGKNFLGGKGFNQYVACRKIYNSCRFVGAIGNDSYGNEFLQSDFADDAHFQIKDCSTGVANVVIDSSGDNLIILNKGANYQIDFNEELKSLIDDSDIIVTQNEIPFEVNLDILQYCKENNKFSIFNTAPWSDYCIDLVNECNLAILNEIEFSHLDIVDHNTSYIVTLGALGSKLIVKDTQATFKPYEVDVVDTTGAGDAFIGGLAAALSQGNKLEDAISYANLVGALTTTKAGSSCASPNVEEINEWINNIRFIC